MKGTALAESRLLGPGPEPHEILPRLAGRPGAFLLESALRSVPRARWSYLGAHPFLVLAAKGRRTWTERAGQRSDAPRGVFRELRALLGRYRASRAGEAGPDQPELTVGAVGFLAYELGRLIEQLPGRAPDDLGLPDLHLGLYDATLAYDHRHGVWHASAAEFAARSAAERRRRRQARIAALGDLVSSGPAPSPSCAAGSAGAGGPLRSNFRRDEYQAAVARVLEYIRAGDIFQANLSQRFAAEWPPGAVELYRRLRRVNPAPFAAYYDFGAAQVVSASPELFLHVAGRRVETRPIKGTRPRGASAAEDRRQAAELSASPKDRAELTMIVDLERNDLGRVCAYGSVRVEEHLALESFPTVHHLVSTVAGELHEGRDLVDLLRATFPGGSITGAPKIRAMQIIDELERSARGVYTGALGFLGFDGVMELNLPIRTFTAGGGWAYFGVGGGVVADSSPAGEYEETLHKARGLVAALEVPA